MVGVPAAFSHLPRITSGIFSQKFAAKSSSENGCSSSRTRAVDSLGAGGANLGELLLLLSSGGWSVPHRSTCTAAKAEQRLRAKLFHRARNLPIARPQPKLHQHDATT